MELNVYVLLGVIFIALITEIVVNALKVFIPENDYHLTKILSIIVGIALAVLSGMDLFVAFGYPLYLPYFGSAFTGIICSLGAGAIYDLIESYKDYRDRLAIEKTE